MRRARWPGLLLTSVHVYGREKEITSGASAAQNLPRWRERYARNCVNVRALTASSQAIGGRKAPACCREPMKAATRNHSSYVRALHPWHKTGFASRHLYGHRA